MKLNEIKDAKYYEGEDKEIGIILFHAYTGSPNDMNLLARELNRNGYGVLCPSFEGHATKDVNDILDADITTWHILHTLKKIIKRSLCSKRAFNSQFDSEETKSYMKYNVTIKKISVLLKSE